MFKRFIVWFICFGLSFLLSAFGWTEQGKAFLYVSLGFDALIVLLFILAALFTEFSVDEDETDFASHALATIIISLIATWGATKIFCIDFYIAYQIMTFGQCWDTSRN